MALGRWVRTGSGALWTMAGVIDGLWMTNVWGVAQVRIDSQRGRTIGYEIIQPKVHNWGCCS